jgi:hypothetical protein
MLRSPARAAFNLVDRICSSERKRLGQLACHPAARAMKARGRKMAKLAAAGRG